MRELQQSQSTDLRRLLLTTCVLKRVHKVSKEMILNNHRATLSLSTLVDPPSVQAAEPTSELAKTPPESAIAAIAKELPFRVPVPPSSITSKPLIECDSDQENAENAAVPTLITAQPRQHPVRRSRRVREALQGLAHGLLLRRRAAVEKDEALQSMNATVNAFSQLR